jgi:hypothetical protein
VGPCCTIQKHFQKGAIEEYYCWNLYILFTQESKEKGGEESVIKFPNFPRERYVGQ